MLAQVCQNGGGGVENLSVPESEFIFFDIGFFIAGSRWSAGVAEIGRKRHYALLCYTWFDGCWYNLGTKDFVDHVLAQETRVNRDDFC